MIFFLEKGFSFMEIGFILSTINLFSVLIQPIYPRILSIFPNLTIHFLLQILFGFSIFLTTAMYFVQNSFWFYLLIFIFISMTQVASNSLLNSLAMSYINSGLSINFGLSRGIGSIFHALVAYIFGKLIVIFGVNFLLTMNIFLLILLIISIGLMRLPENNTVQNSEISKINIPDFHENMLLNVMCFFRRDQSYTLFLFASFLIFIGNCLMGSSFAPNLVGRFGGDASDAGKLVAFISIFETVPMVLFSYVRKKINTTNLIIISAFGFVGRSFCSLFANDIPTLLRTQFFQCFGFGLYSISSVYFTNDNVSPRDRVLSQGLLFSVMAGGNMVANLLSGPLLEYFDVQGMLIVCVITTTIGAVLMIISILKIQKRNNAML